MDQQMRPRIGVSVIVLRDGMVLLGHRRASHGAGSWQFPGGHLEYGEAIADCAAREVLEETGLRLAALRPGPYTNDIFADEGKHYVTLFLLGEAPEGEPAPLEPEKCDRWDWFRWDALPQPLFLPIRNLLADGFDPSRFSAAQG